MIILSNMLEHDIRVSSNKKSIFYKFGEFEFLSKWPIFLYMYEYMLSMYEYILIIVTLLKTKAKAKAKAWINL